MQHKNAFENLEKINLKKQLNKKQENLRTKSAVMHKEIKMRMLESNYQTKTKMEKQDSDLLDIEIRKNFAEDLDEDVLINASQPTNRLHLLESNEGYYHKNKPQTNILKTDMTQLFDDYKLDAESEELCRFMDHLDMGKFIDEVENNHSPVQPTNLQVKIGEPVKEKIKLREQFAVDLESIEEKKLKIPVRAFSARPNSLKAVTLGIKLINEKVKGVANRVRRLSAINDRYANTQTETNFNNKVKRIISGYILKTNMVL